MGKGVRWFVGLATLAGGLALWVWLSARETPSPGAVVAPSVQSRGEPADGTRQGSEWVPRTAPDPDSAAGRWTVGAGEDSPDPAASVATSPFAGSDAREIGGRVRVLDAAGAPLPEARGIFFLAFSSGARTDTRPVHFARGTWSLALEPAHDWRGVTIRVPTVDGADARVEQPLGEVPWPLERRLDLVLRVRPPALLRVLDAATGVELDEVCVRGPSGPRFGGPLFPGGVRNYECEWPRRPSPVEIDRFGRASTGSPLLVGVPGYAWQPVRYDFVAGGTRTILMERGAAITVHGEHPGAESRTFLRLYARETSGEALIHEQLLSSGPLEVHDLPAGAYRVALEVGLRSTPSGVLAERRVELVPGEALTLRLDGSWRPERASAPLSGTASVPDLGRLQGRLSMEIVPDREAGSIALPTHVFDAQPTGAAAAGRREFVWSVPNAPVGRLRIEIPALSFSLALDVPPEGRDDVQIVVPDLAQLTVRLERYARGPEDPDPTLRWDSGEEAASDAVRVQQAKLSRGAPSWRIQAAVGPLRLRVLAPPHGFSDEWVTLGPGEQEQTLRLRPLAGLRLRLRDSGTPVDIPADLEVRLTPLAGRGRVLHVDGDPFARRFHLDQPGSYRLELSALRGYRPPEPAQIDLIAGRVTEHVIELRPERP